MNLKRHLPLVIVFIAFLGVCGRANEIGFIEDFSLATDRTVPLQQLIPGTEEHYFYHCLHQQTTGAIDAARETLAQWIKRHGYTARLEEMRNRQALLEYPQNPEASLAHIRNRLGLRFDHQQKVMDRKPTHPTTLDQGLISRETLTRIAFSSHSNLDGFEDSALAFLIAAPLNPVQRRALLARLRRPDFPNLPQLVVDDLRTNGSRGFGSHPIHKQMLLTQLDACLELEPDLLNSAEFANVYMAKLRPGPDVDWEHDVEAKLAYLEQLWAFVRRLPSSQNSLKANVLFHRLSFDRSQDVYDRDRFTTYLQLPRNVFYVSRAYLQRPENRGRYAHLNQDFAQFTRLASVTTDEPLVRAYLQHFLVEADGYEEFASYIESDYLKEVFAEAKILNGVGDMQQWYSLLTPTKYQALKDRVDIELLPSNPEVFTVDEAVTLQVAVKNVATLIVKTYEINTVNYYRENRKEISTGIDLDGLVANDERVIEYKQVPLRRHVERIAFPGLTGPGVYIVELIGNGRSSRALIRKGRLNYMMRVGSAGHVFTVYDEANARIRDATLWMDGHEYRPDADGEITVPFTGTPGEQQIVLIRDGFAALHAILHEAEDYHLWTGIYVDREALLAGRLCQVLVRPVLTVGGRQAALDLLENPVLTIESQDREGIATVKQVRDFVLHQDQESVYEFRVPDKLARITFSLEAKLQNLSQNREITLQSTSKTYDLNAIERTEVIEALHLRQVTGHYLLELLGKTGEAKPDRPLQIEFKHRDFKRPVHVTLQTDANGRVDLGALDGIAILSVNSPDRVDEAWHLLANRDACHAPHWVQGPAGAPLQVPFMGSALADTAQAVSLLEVRDGIFVRDWHGSVRLEDGFAVLDDLPPGDYDMYLKDSEQSVRIRLTQGRVDGMHLLSRDRYLELRDVRPLQIVRMQTEADGGTLRIQLANTSATTRVHVFADRFVPAHNAFRQLQWTPSRGPVALSLRRPVSLYVSGRNIGDEYRYILERKYATRLPGNMLTRPSLLLNPWSLRKTDAGTDRAAEGEVWADKAVAPSVAASTALGAGAEAARPTVGSFANLDFLSSTALVLPNLKPDKDGVVTADLGDLGARRHLHVIAVDTRNTTYRTLALDGAPDRYRDLRLARALDPAQHFTEQKRVTPLLAGAAFTIDDMSTAKFETYDSLARVYALFTTLSEDPDLAEFEFVQHWPDLPPERKRELYSKYACHELSFFLYAKDRDFFNTVVLPHVRNKKDKTFLDHWLVGSDLSGYLKPWPYQRLNVVERILLARPRRDRAEATARHVRDLFDLLAPDVERTNHLFKTALRGSALEAAPVPTAGFGADFGAAAVFAAPAPAAVGAPGGMRPRTAVTNQLGVRREAEKTKEMRLLTPTGEAMARRKQAAVDGRQALVRDAAAKAEIAKEDDARRRREVRQLYRKLDKTEEWVENNYYHLPIEKQLADLVTANAFWRDYAAHSGAGPFLSPHVAEASRNFPEMMFALAVLDLPFTAGEHEVERTETSLTMTPAGPALVFHKEIRPAQDAEDAMPLLVSQNFFARDDRYRHENNERFDKFVTAEFQTHRVYGCQIVLTNPTSGRRKIDVLLEIPKGAIPVANGLYTRSDHYPLEPYSTQAIEYYFYFPLPGQFGHYPVHVAEDEKRIASAAPFVFNVVDKLSIIDKTSWPYVSQYGTDAEVLQYLGQHNIDRLDLDLIAFRMREKPVFTQVLDLLESRFVYSDTLWAYALYHRDVPKAREYLQHSAYAQQCGLYIDTPLLAIDPVRRHMYQHREYWPLVNARAYPLGPKRKILNQQFYTQYTQFMTYLSYRPALDDADLLAVTYYLLLQDRAEDGMRFFDRVKPAALQSTMQYDYAKAYLAFYRETPDAAVAIARRYRDYPVDRWRKRFLDVIAQAEEIEGAAAQVVDAEDRAQRQTQLAATEPSLDFKVEDRKITVQYQNLDACTLNYYLMDIELLFSRNPFVQEVSGQFAIIRPNESRTVELPKGRNAVTFDLPEQYRDSNVMIEIGAGGITKAQAYYPHSLDIRLLSNYGQVRLAHATTRAPLPKVYIKVYARTQDGEIRFYKDGYTDLRGRFDYTSLNTNEIENVERFAILILSEKHGAAIRETAPPKM